MSDILDDMPANDALKTGRFARSYGQPGKHNYQTDCEEKPFYSSPLVLKKVDCICQKYVVLDKPGLVIKLIWTYGPELWHCGENITFYIPFHFIYQF